MTITSNLTPAVGTIGSPINSYGIRYDNKQYAGDTFSALTRQQWSDYVQTFVPVENTLLKYATEPGVVSSAMTQASTNVNNAFDSQQGQTQRRLQGLGLTLNSDEQAAQERSTGLSRSLADVGAQNIARDTTRQRQMSVIGNPAPLPSASGAATGNS